MQFESVVRSVVFSIAIAGLSVCSAQGQTRTLSALFTPTPIQVDGNVEGAWSKSTPSDITICMNPRRTAPIGDFANFVLFGKPLPEDVRQHLTTDPYFDAGVYERYYGGLKSMMPWGSETR
jgi:hypothetical protein